MRLTILHFNDLHGRLDQMPRLFTLIQRERADAARAGRQVLLLDGGDSSDRSSWESDVTKGRANFSLLEAMGVQATVVGNGEALQWGRAALARMVGSVHFPVLAANLVASADPTQPAVLGLLASTMLDLDGFPLGVVGVTQEYPGGYERFGYVSTDPIPTLKREIESLRARGARSLLLLSHLGVAVSPEARLAWDNPAEQSDDTIAQALPEIDVIVGGHSHTALNAPLVIGKTVIVQAGEYGRYLGRLDLDVDDASGAVQQHTGRLIACDDSVPLDPTIQGTLELVREEADRLLDKDLGAVPSALPHFIDQPSPMAGRVADALRDVCAADLAIFFNGFVHRGLAAGRLTRRDLYQALPGSAHVTAAAVSGAQVRRLLECMLASKYRTESFSPQRNAPPLGLPAVSSNVLLEYDLSRNQVMTCLIDGQPLAPDGRYRLASTYYTLNDRRGEPEYDFIGLEAGQAVEMVKVEKVLWEIVEGYVKEKGGL